MLPVSRLDNSSEDHPFLCLVAQTQSMPSANSKYPGRDLSKRTRCIHLSYVKTFNSLAFAVMLFTGQGPHATLVVAASLFVAARGWCLDGYAETWTTVHSGVAVHNEVTPIRLFPLTQFRWNSSFARHVVRENSGRIPPENACSARLGDSTLDRQN